MSAQFYFMFSCGDYGDYSVDGVCVCDHPVSKDDWHVHYYKFKEGCEKRGPKDGQTWDEWYDAGGHAKLERWKTKNDPVKTFKKLHGMNQVALIEFRRDL